MHLLPVAFDGCHGNCSMCVQSTMVEGTNYNLLPEGKILFTCHEPVLPWPVCYCVKP